VGSLKPDCNSSKNFSRKGFYTHRKAMPPLIKAFINNSINFSFLFLPNRVMKESRDEEESVDICDEGLISSTIISSSEFCPEADSTGDPEGGSSGSDSSGLTDSRDLK